MKILVMGGTRYFGKRLVQLLIEKGHQVTVANRGTTPDTFGAQVERKIVERADPVSVGAVAKARDWDAVVDQICYSPDEAKIACDAFEGRTQRYVHTSTASVYEVGGERFEKDFDPFNYEPRLGSRADFPYGEAKRLAETYYFQKAKFPVVAMRIPIVLGADDYTGRLEFHLQRVSEGRPMVIPNLNSETSFIDSGEAARFLLWLVEGSGVGPINACSNGRLSIGEILKVIERRLNKSAVVCGKGLKEDATPFVDEESKYLNHERAKGMGFKFEPLATWFPQLVDWLALKGKY